MKTSKYIPLIVLAAAPFGALADEVTFTDLNTYYYSGYNNNSSKVEGFDNVGFDNVIESLTAVVNDTTDTYTDAQKEQAQADIDRIAKWDSSKGKYVTKGGEVNAGFWSVLGSDGNYYAIVNGSLIQEPSASTHLVFQSKNDTFASWFSGMKVASITVDCTDSKYNNLALNTNQGYVIQTYGDFTATGGNINSRGGSFLKYQQSGKGGANGFDIDGNLNIGSDSYYSIFHEVNANQQYNSSSAVYKYNNLFSTYGAKVGGVINMNHDGSDKSGFVRLHLAETKLSVGTVSDGTNSGQGVTAGVLLDNLIVEGTAASDKNAIQKVTPVYTVGGLNGNGVISATTWFSSDSTIEFKPKNENIAFQGGEWTGAITKFTFVSETDKITFDKDGLYEKMLEQKANSKQTFKFVMDTGSSEKIQKINLQKSSTFMAANDRGTTHSEDDMDAVSLEVKSGRIEFNSEVALESITFANTDSSDMAILKFASDEKVGTFKILYPVNAGINAFVNTGKIKVGELDLSDIIAPSADEATCVIFTDADITALNGGQSLTVLEYDSLLFAESIEASANDFFKAVDENGDIIEGSFNFTNLDGAGSLVFSTVPEPATIAGILGAIALAFAIRRRK